MPRTEYQKQWEKKHLDKVREYRRRYFRLHHKEISEKQRKFRKDHPDAMKKYYKCKLRIPKDLIYERNKLIYQARIIQELTLEEIGKIFRRKGGPLSRQRILQIVRKYQNHPEYIKEKEKRNQRRKERRQTDFKFRLDQNIGSKICECLRGKKANRRWEELVGYTLEDLIKHLESLFEPWMNWDNYGKWEIDHIKPKSSFYYETAEDLEFKKCWGLENLRPLEKTVNNEKRDKFDETT